MEYPSVCVDVTIMSAANLSFKNKEWIWIENHEVESFIEQLKKLDDTRKGEAVLRSMGPRDMELVIYSKDERGHLEILLKLYKDDREGYGFGHFNIEIGFEIDAGSIGQIIQNFRELIDYEQ
ncbi:MAG: hypothetical protein H3C54_08195 [Taibaiella sp.]|nr:hypothetical protein [Taibaiella sp.]